MFRNFAFIDLGFPEALILIVVLVIGVAIFVFEVKMFIHALRNHYLSDSSKLLWAIGMLFIHPFVAIAYYFTDYRKGI
jgi:hypothetical protein